MKKISLIPNHVGGIDLLTERDSGNEILILTGNKKNSIDFWQRLYDQCSDALACLNAPTEEEMENS
jgi:hypothetical protein